MKSFFSLYESTLNFNHTLMEEWIKGQRMWVDHALRFYNHTQKMSEKIVSPLTIFSPPIMRDTYVKMQDVLQTLKTHKPDEIHAIYARYTSDLEYLISYMTCGGQDFSHFKPIVDDRVHDRRFQHDAWSKQPYFILIKQFYLVHVRFFEDILKVLDACYAHTDHDNFDHAVSLDDAGSVLNFDAFRPAFPKADADVLDKWRFYIKQMLSALSPTNFPLTNPEVLEETRRTKGKNLQRGLQNFMRDMKRGYLSMTDMRAFQVGQTIARTPGHVVFENDLLQLIRYTPQKKRVYQNPMMIIPAWINKYYLFDLTEQTSFVKWCLDHGMDVYIVSWVNPTSKAPSKTFCDYALEGMYQAVRFVLKNAKTTQLNAIGNCAGGILLNCLMAYLERHHISSPFASATTLASPIDGSKLGDLKTFICKNQLRLLEESLDDFNIIPGHILVQSFNLLRPQELLWSFYIKHYLMGKDPEAFDVLFWNCDSMNLPGRMHSQYLRNIFLDNKLMKKGAMRLGGTPIDLGMIQTPSFILGAKKDHIAPWDSVYALLNQIQSPIKEFVLTGSGHVSGIINHPDRHKYQYWTNPKTPAQPTEWLKDACEHDGSWWNYWVKWVQPFLGKLREPLDNCAVIEDAPGRYVFQQSAQR